MSIRKINSKVYLFTFQWILLFSDVLLIILQFYIVHVCFNSVLFLKLLWTQKSHCFNTKYYLHTSITFINKMQQSQPRLSNLLNFKKKLTIWFWKLNQKWLVFDFKNNKIDWFRNDSCALKFENRLFIVSFESFYRQCTELYFYVIKTLFCS